MNITVQPFGKTPNGEQAYLYTLENNHGLSVTISTFGGIITNIMAPDKDGNFADVVLAHAGLEQYFTNPGSLGATIGRNANRIANAQVIIDDITYDLLKNDGENNLHTGPNGLQFQLFEAEAVTTEDTASVRLFTVVYDMEDGFPGTLEVQIDFTLTNDNALVLEYLAVADKDTVINLTNHSYFNLAGHNSGSVGNQTLWVNADFYSPNTTESIPTGEIRFVEDTPMDFREPTLLQEALDKDFEQLKMFSGLDHNFVLNDVGYRRVARLEHPESGRIMHVSTDLPAMHVYTGNNLSSGDTPEKDDASYTAHDGICFETQTVPNSAAMPWLASPIYPAGEEFYATTTFRFEVAGEESENDEE